MGLRYLQLIYQSLPSGLNHLSRLEPSCLSLRGYWGLCRLLSFPLSFLLSLARQSCFQQSEVHSCTGLGLVLDGNAEKLSLSLSLYEVLLYSILRWQNAEDQDIIILSTTKTAQKGSFHLRNLCWEIENSFPMCLWPNLNHSSLWITHTCRHIC